MAPFVDRRKPTWKGRCPGRLLVAGMVAMMVGILVSACGGVELYTFVQPAEGQIVFGTDIDPAHQAIKNPITSAALGTGIGMAAAFPHTVTGEIEFEARGPNGQATTAPFRLEDLTQPYDHMWATYGLGTLPEPGHYVFRFILGTEVLATGELDVTASPVAS